MNLKRHESSSCQPSTGWNIFDGDFMAFDGNQRNCSIGFSSVFPAELIKRQFFGIFINQIMTSTNRKIWV